MTNYCQYALTSSRTGNRAYLIRRQFNSGADRMNRTVALEAGRPSRRSDYTDVLLADSLPRLASRQLAKFNLVLVFVGLGRRAATPVRPYRPHLL
jgi:hypothetical protein